MTVVPSPPPLPPILNWMESLPQFIASISDLSSPPPLPERLQHLASEPIIIIGETDSDEEELTFRRQSRTPQSPNYSSHHFYPQPSKEGPFKAKQKDPWNAIEERGFSAAVTTKFLKILKISGFNRAKKELKEYTLAWKRGLLFCVVEYYGNYNKESGLQLSKNAKKLQPLKSTVQVETKGNNMTVLCMAK